MIHHGPYSPTLDGMTWDALIVDPPYSARTHTGHDGSVKPVADLRKQLARMEARFSAGRSVAKRLSTNTDAQKLTEQRRRVARAESTTQVDRRPLTYAPWTPDDVRQFVQWAAPRTRGWMVCMCDHALAPHYMEAMEAAGRYVFAPLVWYAAGSRVRMVGDGPSCWTVWIIVSRPKGPPFSSWGTLPGGYTESSAGNRSDNHIGGKPLALMRRIVADYSRPGDVVCDPCAGWGTTLRAAQLEGRQWLGCDADGEAVAAARARLAEPYEVPLIAHDPVQESLFKE
jgi:hypothetical protein